MEQIITNFIGQWGYAAIFILILLENVLPVVPSEIILTFAGLMSVKSGLSILVLFIISTIASFIGLLILKKVFIDLLINMVNGSNLKEMM